MLWFREYNQFGLVLVSVHREMGLCVLGCLGTKLKLISWNDVIILRESETTYPSTGLMIMSGAKTLCQIQGDSGGSRDGGLQPPPPPPTHTHNFVRTFKLAKLCKEGKNVPCMHTKVARFSI